MNYVHCNIMGANVFYCDQRENIRHYCIPYGNIVNYVILYNYVDFQINRNKMVSCDDCQEWFHVYIIINSCSNMMGSSSTGNGTALTVRGILI